MEKLQIRKDAADAARASIDQGFLNSVKFDSYDDVEAALRGACYGDQHGPAPDPWEEDIRHVDENDLLLWISIWRDELFALSRRELGL